MERECPMINAFRYCVKCRARLQVKQSGTGKEPLDIKFDYCKQRQKPRSNGCPDPNSAKGLDPAAVATAVKTLILGMQNCGSVFAWIRIKQCWYCTLILKKGQFVNISILKFVRCLHLELEFCRIKLFLVFTSAIRLCIRRAPSCRQRAGRHILSSPPDRRTACSLLQQITGCSQGGFKLALLWIWMFLGLLDPDPLVRGGSTNRSRNPHSFLQSQGNLNTRVKTCWAGQE